MKKKTVLTTILAASMTIAACGTASNDSSADEGKITITLKHGYRSENIGKYSEETGVLTMLQKFREDYPDIEVVEEQVAFEEYGLKAQTLAASNDLPDVFQLPGSYMSNFVKNGMLAELNEDLDKRPEWRDGYRKGTFDRATYDGSIYGIPMAAGPTHIIFYNSKMFAEVGYSEFPATWEELRDASEKLKAKGILPFAFANKDKGYALDMWFSVLADRFAGPEWTKSIVEGTGAKYTDPEFVSALTLLSDMAKAEYFNKDLNSIDGDAMHRYFYEGKAAAFVDGIWDVNNQVTNAPKDVLDATKVAVFPSVAGGKGNPKSSSGGAGVYYSVSSSVEPGPKRDAIMTLLQYLTGDGSAKIMASVGGFPAYDPGEFDESKLHRLAVDTYGAANAAPASRIFGLWFEASVNDVLKTGLQDLLIGARTPEQVAEETQEEYEFYLENKDN
ncbi:extracellular solute-binding protein [Paenibacillus sp.]|uniref:extracellular solute-binding protein n=1 Tax=Paenibacillus sp. TaxID=58172 RepID=UPI002D295F01|nr:extracellular solute-binding protein [Paenibacillus sp.]HZG85808.1 extracellular solute-binding protein [Paenibacillus sp.]